MTVTERLIETPPAVDAPYPGLTHFTEEYEDFFFGRDSECDVIVGNLCASRLTLLYAQSGVGKSSVLRAGVASRIRRQAMSDRSDARSPRFVGVVFSTWTEDAVAGLVAAIDRAIAPFHHDPVDLSGLTLDEAVEAATATVDTTLLVILDQFEEYFLYHADEGGDTTFADQLARCVNRPNLHVNVLISIREDMYARLGDLFRGRIAHVYGNFLHLDYLDADGGREAIVKPIELLRRSRPEVGIEPALVDAVLAGVQLRRGPEIEYATEAGGVQIETAYLQLVMRRLWDEEVSAHSSVLRLETLDRLGGTQEIIEGHLNGALQELSEPEQAAAAAAFRFLVTRAGTKIAWTTKDLAEVSGVAEEDLGPVLRRLASQKLKILRPAGLHDEGEGASYEIFHDALARPIVRWRDDQALARERAARAEAEQQAVYAEAREAHERRRKRLALTALGIAVAALVAVAALFAVVQSNRANARLKADQSSEIAGRVAGSALAPGAMGVASLEAMRLSSTFASRSTAVGELQENAALPTVIAGDTRAVLAVAFANDDSGRVATGSSDATLRLWNRDGSPGQTFHASDEHVITSVAFDATEGYVFAGQNEGSVYAWRLASGKRLPVYTSTKKTEQCTETPCNPIGISPDGKLLAAGGSDGTVRVWDVPRATLVATVHEPAAVHALAFSSDGRQLAVGENGGVVRWRVSPGGRLSDLESVKTSRPALAVAWSPDGKIAAAHGDVVEVWTAAGGPLTRFTATDTVNAVAFLDGGARIAYGGNDDAVSERDLTTGDMVGAPRSHAGSVDAIAVDPGGTRIASTGDDDYLKLWPADASGSLASISLGVTGMTNLGVTDDGRIAAGSRSISGFVRIWTPSPVGASLRRAASATVIKGYTAPLSVHGSILAASSAQGTSFALWNIGRSCPSMPQTPCRLGSSPGSAGTDLFYSFAFSGSGTILATGTSSGLALWDVSQRRHPRRLVRRAIPTGVNEFAFDPNDDTIFATASQDGAVRLWQYRDGRLVVLSSQRRRDAVYAIAFSGDGTTVAAGGADQTISLWHVNDPRHPQAIPWPVLQTNSVLSIAFSPDSRYVVAGDGDGSACIYDVRSLRSVGSDRCLTGALGGSVDAVAFEPSGDVLLTAGRGQPVVAWKATLWGNASADAIARAVCRLNGGRSLTPSQWSFAFANTKLAGHMHRTCS